MVLRLAHVSSNVQLKIRGQHERTRADWMKAIALRTKVDFLPAFYFFSLSSLNSAYICYPFMCFLNDFITPWHLLSLLCDYFFSLDLFLPPPCSSFLCLHSSIADQGPPALLFVSPCIYSGPFIYFHLCTSINL